MSLIQTLDLIPVKTKQCSSETTSYNPTKVRFYKCFNSMDNSLHSKIHLNYKYFFL